MRSRSVRTRSADDRLIRAFGDGDDTALQELFIRFDPDVFGIGLHCFRSPEAADAFVERTFVTMWQRSSQYASTSMPLETWVVIQALRVALQMSASRAGEPPRAGSVEGTKTDGDHVAVA
jgi:DNA-directed RNA polymerase specialized sigma24 family protein